MSTVDLYTGQPRPTVYQQQDSVKTQVAGPQVVNTQQQQVSRTKGSQTTANAQFALNTTPEILATLEQFITQMVDRPALSDVEAERNFPDAKPIYTKEGWYYVNPKTGMSIPNYQVEQFNRNQAVKRQQAQEASGVIRGGTADQRQRSEARQQEIATNRSLRSQYSPEAADARAQGLSSYFARMLAEEEMPGILRGAEGAGASQSTARALLTEKAVGRTADNAARLGAELSSQYGNISAQFGQILENLTKEDPNSIANQLIQAIAQSRGLVQSSVGTQRTDTDQTTTSQTNAQQVTAPQVTDVYTDINPAAPAANFGSSTPSASGYQPSSLAGTGYIQVNTQQDPYENVTYSQPNSRADVSYYGGDGQFFD